MIRLFEKTTGIKLNYDIGERREGDIEQVWGDVTKAEKLLNWKAELNLEAMLTSAWAWEKALFKSPLLQMSQQ